MGFPSKTIPTAFVHAEYTTNAGALAVDDDLSASFVSKSLFMTPP
jgi:hypothetical protein